MFEEDSWYRNLGVFVIYIISTRRLNLFFSVVSKCIHNSIVHLYNMLRILFIIWIILYFILLNWS